MKALIAEPLLGYLDPLPTKVETFALPNQGQPERAALAAEALVLIGNPEQARELIPQLPHLRLIQTTSAGVDWLLPYLPPGVLLCNGSGIHDVPVAEWVVATLFYHLKELDKFRQQQQQQVWQNAFLPDLEGQTILLLGYGSIGKAVEARLSPFGVQWLRVARTARPGVFSPNDLPALLPQADAVVALLPHTEATQGLIDAPFLASMKPGALLLNAGRGSAVDSQALRTALEEGRLRAALDVTNPEPLPAGHPLWQAPNLLITPHIAGYSRNIWTRAGRFVRQQIERYLAHQPLENRVEAGY